MWVVDSSGRIEHHRNNARSCHCFPSASKSVQYQLAGGGGSGACVGTRSVPSLLSPPFSSKPRPSRWLAQRPHRSEWFARRPLRPRRSRPRLRRPKRRLRGVRTPPCQESPSNNPPSIPSMTAGWDSMLPKHPHESAPPASSTPKIRQNRPRIAAAAGRAYADRVNINPAKGINPHHPGQGV